MSRQRGKNLSTSEMKTTMETSNRRVRGLSERMRTLRLEIERLEQTYDGQAYPLVRHLLEQVRDLAVERQAVLGLENV